MPDVHGPAWRPRAQRRHAELGGDGARPVIPVIDARDDALEFDGVEGPRHDELASLLRKALPLGFRPQGTEQLEIAPVECSRSDEPCDSHTRLTFHDREYVVGMPLMWQRQRTDELPHVVLPLQGAEKFIVGLA